MTDITTRLATFTLKNPCFNAAGPKCVTEQELRALGESGASAILSKSMTVEPREGNPEPRYVDFGKNSINSMGLPNLGYEQYQKILPSLREYDKPIIASIAGLSKEDNVTIAKAFSSVDIDAIELNLSCPNVPGEPQVGYDFERSGEYIKSVQEVCDKPLGVKLPPYFDFAHFEKMAKVLNERKVAFITCINSVGNGLVIDPNKEEAVIKPKGGFGGLGGEIVKPVGLSNVRKFRELLDKDIQIIGVGGIVTGTDAFEYILAGADCLQLGTILMQEGLGAFERIGKELQDLMEKKGYESLDDFRNKLKEL